MSETRKIYGAIAAMLADMDAIGKDKKNQQQGFMYRGIDQVFNSVHPLFAKHKVFPTCEILSREVTERQTKTGGVLFYVNMKVRYTFWAEDGSSVTSEAWGEAMDSGDKASNKAMSVSYKYAMFQLLCIPTEAVDPDTEVHKDIVPTAAKAQPRTTTQLATDEPAVVTKAKAMTLDERYETAKRTVLLAKDEQRLDDLETSIVNHPDFSEDQKNVLVSFVTKRRDQLAEMSPA